MRRTWRVLVWFATGSGYVPKSPFTTKEEALRLAGDWSDAAAVRIQNIDGAWEQVRGNSNLYP